MLKLLLRNIVKISDYKYYKDMAKQLKINIPNLNEDLNISHEKKCIVYGLKIVQKQLLSGTLEEQPGSKAFTINSQQKQSKKDQEEIIQNNLANVHYELDINNTEILQFSEVLKAARNLQTDIILVQQDDQKPQLTLKNIRKQIYKKYYHQVFKKKAKRDYKVVKISQNIAINDLNTKVNQTKAHIQEGFRHFRVYTDSDSDKAQKKLYQFSELLGKSKQQVQPKLFEVKQTLKKYIKSRKIPQFTTPNLKKQISEMHFKEKKLRTKNLTNQAKSQMRSGKNHGEEEERWMLDIYFDEEIPLNIEYINKKYYRKLTNEKYQNQQRKSTINLSQINFASIPESLQREYINMLEEQNLQLPDHLKGMGKLKAKNKFQMVQQIIKRRQTRVKNKQHLSSAQVLKVSGLQVIQQLVSQLEMLKNKPEYELTSFQIWKIQFLQQKIKNLTTSHTPKTDFI